MTQRPRMRRVLLTAFGAAVLLMLFAVPASATLPNGEFSGVMLTPATPAAPTTAAITISPPGIESLTGSLDIRFMLGFASSTRSVSMLCTAPQGAAGQCPAGALVGTGTVTVGSTLGMTSVVPLTLALGAPAQPGDIGTIYLYSDAGGHLASSGARLFTGTNAGPELLLGDVSRLVVLNPGFRVEGLTLTLHAVRTITATKYVRQVVGTGRRRKHRLVRKRFRTVYSLLTTPPLCAGPWTGETAMTLNAEANMAAFVIPCTSGAAGAS
jgi:hypothetical protein